MGGATFQIVGQCNAFHESVSIAEAILWGEQLQLSRALVLSPIQTVSIAEAILWGEQRLMKRLVKSGTRVSIAEAILWGSNANGI